MIIIRTIYTSLSDWQKLRDLLVEYRDHYPKEQWKIYNTITGESGVVVTDQLFRNDDPGAVAYQLYDPRRLEEHASDPWHQAWREKARALEIDGMERELWRLMD
jgi:lysyl-tRNA synthetase class I